MSRSKIRSGVAWLSSVALATALVSAIGMASSAPTSSGGSPTKVKTTYGGDPTWFTTSASWQNVPGARLTLNVPAGQQALLLARFSGYVACWNTDVFASPCQIRIRATGPAGTSNMNPKFGLLDMNGSDPNAFAIDRSFGPVGSGSYTFKVQVRNPGPDQTTGVGYWHLTLERLST